MTTVTYSIGEWIQCAGCGVVYKCLCHHLRWWWVDGQGPYCEKCMKGIATVTTVSEEKPDGQD